MIKILFLCTGNSCRSIMAEAIMNYYGAGRFQAVSAGSDPIGHINKDALKTLEKFSIPYIELSSKSWNDFANQNFDIVITVCDAAAEKTCPVFNGRAIKAHWNIKDPSLFKHLPEEAARAFTKCYKTIEEKIIAILDLKLEEMNEAAIKIALERISLEKISHE